MEGDSYWPGVHVNNPVGQILFGDSATPVRVTLGKRTNQRLLLRLTQQARLVFSLLKEEDKRGDNNANWLVEEHAMAS